MININGKSYSGRSIQISNGNVIIDGKNVNIEEKQITILVDGNIEHINADQCQHITVTGSCGPVKTMSGDVSCSDIHGSVSTMSGDIWANDIAGNAQSMSGDITTIEKP